MLLFQWLFFRDFEYSRGYMMRNFAAIVIGVLSLHFFVNQNTAQNVQDTKDDKSHRVTLDAQIDPASLGLNFTLQMANYPQRQGSLPVVMRYSSKVWNIEFESSWWDPSLGQTRSYTHPVYKNGWNMSIDPPGFDSLTWDAFDSYGKRVDLQNSRNFNYGDPYYVMPRFKIVTADGASHEMRRGDWVWINYFAYTNNPNVWTGDFYSADGSKMRYNVESGTLFLSDGSRYIQDLINGNPTGGFNTYIDKSGNVQRFISNGWVDTLGRNIPHPYVNVSPSSAQDVNYSLPGLGTDTLDFVFKWKKLEDALTSTASLMHSGNCAFHSVPYSPSLFEGSVNYQYTDVCGPEVVFNPVVLNEVVLPNGTSYKFTYNTYGEIDKIAYPTGAYERYLYGAVTGLSYADEPYSQSNRGVTNRWISSDGTSLSEVQWQYSSTYSGVSTTEPSGIKSERVYERASATPEFGFEDAKIGRLLEEKILDSNQNLTKRSLYSYETTGPVGTTPLGGYAVSTANRDVRPVREVSILFENGNSNALASMSETVYDTTGSSDPAYFSSLNAKETKIYNYVVVNASTAATASISTAASWFSTSDLAKTSEVDFLYDSNYKARNISGLVTETRLKDPSGAIKARSQINYDESGYGLTSPGTMPTAAANSWTDPLTELGSTIGTKRGLPTSSKNYYDIANSYYVETHSFYDQFGNARKSRDARGNDAETLYDDDYGFAYPTKTISPVPGGNGSTTAFEGLFTYDYDTGLVLTVTDPNGAVTEMEYNDDLYRRTKVIAPSAAETTTEYGAGTSASTRWIKSRSQINSTEWKEARSFFDGLGRTVRTQTIDPAGDVFTLTCYDSMGRVSKVTNPFRSYSTQDCSTTSGLEWTTNAYDTAGRPWKLTTPDGAEAVTTYGLAASSGYLLGTVVTVEDQADKQRRSITNSLGHLVRVDEPTTSGTALGSLTSPNQHTSYSYDSLNNLTAVEQGDQDRTFVYDNLSRLKSASNPESGTFDYQYDNTGNVIVKTDDRDVSTHYEYDALNRINRRWYNSSSSTSSTTHDSPALPTGVAYTYEAKYAYDVGTNGKGRLYEAKTGYRPLSQTKWRQVTLNQYLNFDVMGRPQTFRQYIGELVTTYYDVGYSYDLSGAVTTLTYPSGHTVAYDYDSAGKLESMTGNLGDGTTRTYADDFQYTAFGGMGRERFGTTTPLYHKQQYNSRGQLWDMRLSTVTTAGDGDRGAIINDYGTTANNGNVLSQDSVIPSSNSYRQTFTYDSINRLESVTERIVGSGSDSYNQTYVYDRYGNRTINATATFNAPEPQFDNSMMAAANRLYSPSEPSDTCTPTSTTRKMCYDAVGNLIRDKHVTDAAWMMYDGENKMGRYDKLDAQTDPTYYTYDGDGNRKQSSNAATVRYVHGLGGELLAEANASVVSKEYGYRNGDLLITALVSSNPKIKWLVKDHLGSPRLVASISGDLANVKRHDYLPFGEEIASTAFGRSTTQGYGNPQSDGVRQQFTGYERDNESDLDFAQARYYNKSHGRFISGDPLMASASVGNPQTLNRYAYAGNNPINITDPLGLTWYFNSEGNIYDWYDEKTKKFRWGKGELTGSWVKTEEYIYEDAVNGGYVALDRGSKKFVKGFQSRQAAEGQIEQWLMTRPTENISLEIDVWDSQASDPAYGFYNPFSSHGAAGHVSGGLGDKAWSWEGNGWADITKQNLEQYVESNAKTRGGTRFVLDFGSPDKNQKFARLYKDAYAEGSGYNLTNNNCGDAFCRAVNGMGGLPHNDSMLPSSHANFIREKLKQYIVSETRVGPPR